MVSVYVERALFLIGDQNTGKSTQLRSIFRDMRLSKNGDVPKQSNLPNAYPISNERWLYLRLTSPHESNERLGEFLDKCANEMQPNKDRPSARRWNYAGPLQPNATSNLGCAPSVIDEFVKRFKPERIRVAILAPDRDGNMPANIANIASKYDGIPNIEVVFINAMLRDSNGLFYADYFDFT